MVNQTRPTPEDIFDAFHSAVDSLTSAQERFYETDRRHGGGAPPCWLVEGLGITRSGVSKVKNRVYAIIENHMTKRLGVSADEIRNILAEFEPEDDQL